MSRQRKTKREKIISQERKQRNGFVIKDEWLVAGSKKPMAKVELDLGEKKYFKMDLTKTVILTMLVLALELAIWSYLSRH
ncbi:MAG: hypothetical protein UW88_C0006G0052 [Candidatus Collierbacteria bacterium GW2011_GWD2_45_10]|uniref:Uncharacterized protein n=1 Tax=Candidatus Collierbacteria bacterium GW2011_GWB2_44_22 TaxID=1618387 RepID=A0A0G1KWM8_9BACT|nr:MAG: hypothetical protein UW31_C0007G0093 [Candidatus Collierbacteria bacterium GW2011_GWA2_44_13]KKT49159.1 MAG: hypothetical protein UW42_C0039G0008 [Candidatus Collierbacteria bacterium GW2011_GWB1_44_197]KKT52324.1 MAG: hypothetical protein UW44_C0003G0167 [Candidatus Collierbacteria bacterium GW2011_GWB2_44_22]KKT63244.1 MAG: hypothetical protein UW56_C0001G0081 [Candidatus Collierbacteria bacterium GW2011_GWD1_44_27]KKT64512.1 MAG: hypothetical protein UW58_C0041G0002 [Candidatus Colli